MAEGSFLHTLRYLDVLRLLQRYRFSSVPMVHMKDIGRLQREGQREEGPYQDRPPLCPFRL